MDTGRGDQTTSLRGVAQVRSRPMYAMFGVALVATLTMVAQCFAWWKDMAAYDAQKNLPIIAFGMPAFVALFLTLLWLWLLAEALLGSWTIEAGPSGIRVTHMWAGVRLGQVSLPAAGIVSVRAGTVPGTFMRGVLVDCGDDHWHPLLARAGLSQSRAEEIVNVIWQALGVTPDTQAFPVQKAVPVEPKAASGSIWLRDFNGLTLVANALFFLLFLGCIPGLWLYFILLGDVPWALMATLAYLAFVFTGSLLWLRPRVTALFALQEALGQGASPAPVAPLREAVWGQGGVAWFFLGHPLVFALMFGFLGAYVSYVSVREADLTLALIGGAMLLFGIGFWRVSAVYPTSLRVVRRELGVFARSNGADGPALEHAAAALRPLIKRLPDL